MSSRWYVSKSGQVRGPFPTGALVQDWLVGRITDANLVSLDQEDWKPFGSCAELVEAVTAESGTVGSVKGPPSAATPGEPESWVAERTHARVRWADQRSGEDRRGMSSDPDNPDANVSDPYPQRPGDRRAARNDRPSTRQARLGRRAGLFGAELPIWLLVVALLALAALVAVVVHLFGAVNPVTVRFH